MLSEYTIRRFSLDCFTHMQELYCSAYGLPLDADSFRHRYDTRNLGHEVIGHLAFTAEGAVAAYYGVFPVRVRFGETTVLAAQSGDTMTHADHRQKGLFVLLAKKTLEVCRAEGLAFIFGQPNEFSRHGLIHSLRFIHTDNLISYDLRQRIKTLPLPKLLNSPGRRRMYDRYARRLLRGKTVSPREFTNTLPSDLGKIVRDHDYLAYKGSADKYFIRIRGVVLWIKLADVLHIGDVQDYAQLTPQVLRILRRLAFCLGYNTIRFYLNQSVEPPAFLDGFCRERSEPSCFYYLDEAFAGRNLLLTAADFDTW
jgi:hypothetical protein